MVPVLMLMTLYWSTGLQVQVTDQPPGPDCLSPEPDDVRLVGGVGRCAGRVELKHQGEWRNLDSDSYWTLGDAAVVCGQLGCGSAVSTRTETGGEDRTVWWFRSHCDGSESALRQCGAVIGGTSTADVLEVICSESVRLVNGASLCSGRVEVRSDQSWASVCEADFDWQDAEVVCRELGCGAPSVLQGALYGEGKGPIWAKEFQCEGNESRLLDCDTSGSARNTCSPGKAVGLTCSEPDDVRLVGGVGRCAGRVEVSHQGEWRNLDSDSYWTLGDAAVVCGQLGCGSAVSTRTETGGEDRTVWWFRSHCDGSESALRQCGAVIGGTSTADVLEVICSESVRLVNGAGLCSGRVEVRSDQSWASVCEADFDRQDAEVVCRELGCGAPSALQGALYGEGKGPIWAKEFQCEGNESRLLDCDTSGSARNTCSPGKAVGLTCSEPDDVRLVGGASRCAGRLEMNHQAEWRSLYNLSPWTLGTVAVLCGQLGCGSAVSAREATDGERRPVWGFRSDCAGSEAALRECGGVAGGYYYTTNVLEVICSDLLIQPNISLSSSMGGVSQGQQQGLQVFKDHSYNITCSVPPQYPGGSFHLTFTGSTATRRHTRPAVNHSADFLFPAADHAHQGNYSCVYEVFVFSHNFSSESVLLTVTVADNPLTAFIIRLAMIVVVLTLVISTTGLFLFLKTTRGRRLAKWELLVSLHSIAEAETGEEGAA